MRISDRRRKAHGRTGPSAACWRSCCLRIRRRHQARAVTALVEPAASFSDPTGGWTIQQVFLNNVRLRKARTHPRLWTPTCSNAVGRMMSRFGDSVPHVSPHRTPPKCATLRPVVNEVMQHPHGGQAFCDRPTDRPTDRARSAIAKCASTASDATAASVHPTGAACLRWRLNGRWPSMFHPSDSVVRASTSGYERRAKYHAVAVRHVERSNVARDRGRCRRASQQS